VSGGQAAALEVHAKEWEALADASERDSAYAQSRGEYGGAHRNKAATYQAAAKAIRLEAATGAPHCACCLKPNAARASKGGAQ